jgi:hypothetical protein
MDIVSLKIHCNSILACSSTVSGSVLFHPGDILVHPVLQEFLAVCTDVAGLVKQTILYLNECFGLAKRRYVQIRENIAQMLLCLAVPVAPGEAPNTPAGLPAQALWP